MSAQCECGAPLEWSGDAAKIAATCVSPKPNPDNGTDYTRSFYDRFPKHVQGGVPCNSRKTVMRCKSQKLRAVPYSKALEDALRQAQMQNEKVRFELVLDPDRPDKSSISWKLFVDKRTFVAITRNEKQIRDLSLLVTGKALKKQKEIDRLQKMGSMVPVEAINEVREDQRVEQQRLTSLISRILLWMDVTQDDIDAEIVLIALENENE